MTGRTTEFALTQRTLMDAQQNVSVLVVELASGGSAINGASQSGLYSSLALVNKDYIVNEKCLYVCLSILLYVYSLPSSILIVIEGQTFLQS